MRYRLCLRPGRLLSGWPLRYRSNLQIRTGFPNPEEKWLRWLKKVDEYTFRVFPDPQNGEWFGYCDRQGNVTHSLKGGAYKGCFHVPRALLFSVQRIEASSAAV